MIFFCQFCLICAVGRHGRPNINGYVPCTFSCNTTGDMRKSCPPIVTSWSRISPVGRTELVSAIRNQKGHGSHSRMPRVSHVRLLMTFTLDPPSIIVPAIFLAFHNYYDCRAARVHYGGSFLRIGEERRCRCWFRLDDGCLEIHGEPWYQLEQTC